MANTNPFLTAHYEKTALTQQTAKRIQLIYKQSAQDIEKQLRQLRMLTPSDSLKKVYLENLLKDINKSADSFNKTIQNTVLSAGEKSGSIAVEAGNKAMRNAGLTMRGAYSYVPRQQIELIASGKLYGDKWSLSQAIWKNGLRTKSDIQNVVSKGLAQNKPIKDIANDITKYVDPTARKPWDWSKVYPGTAQQVDYNAQRLARTMIQHSYQTSMVQSQLYNPFCKGIVWHSVGIHGRTCELCMERDGNVFPLKDLPLDHPNGLCYFEPALDSMDDIADRLANWAGGGADSALDEYVAKAFGLNPKTTAGKQVIGTQKRSVGGKSTPGKSGKKSTGKKTTSGKAANKQSSLDDFLKGMAEMDRNQAALEEAIDQGFDNLKKKVLASQKTKEAGENIWKELRKTLSYLSDDQLKYMQQAEHRLKAIVPTNGQAFFRPGKWTIHMDLAADMYNKRGAFATFLHEYGHLLDHAATMKGRKYFFTFNSKWRKELYLSLEKEYNKIIDPKTGKLLRDVDIGIRQMGDRSACLQDMISGLSKDKNRIRWGHDADYWYSSPNKLSLETVAHFNLSMAIPSQAEAIRKYFPESYKLLEKELQRFLKAKGLK